MPTAVGIHDHPTFKTGLAKTDPGKRILALDPLLTGKLPTIPGSEDRFSGVTFALDKNDEYGTCGPTSLDNFARGSTKVAFGTQHNVGWPAVEALYKLSGNPNFPNEDNGVEMGVMLDAALAHGFGDLKLVAFGRLTSVTDANLAALSAIFGGSLWGQNLLEAQQAQTEAKPPKWDFKESGEWGGHATYNGKFEPFTGALGGSLDVGTISTLDEMLRAGTLGVDEEVISWAIDVETTAAYRGRQLEEVWVPIFDYHLSHPAFLTGVDVGLLAEAFHELTGKTLPVPPAPVPPAPAPTPSPTPAGETPSAADRALWTEIGAWAHERHVAGNHKAASDCVAWAKVKGLEVPPA